MTDVETNRKELIRKWQNHKPETTPVVFTSLKTKKIAIKDESVNPTGTYKARHGWMMGLHYLTNHFPHNFLYYLGSTGNAGLADFAYADLLKSLRDNTNINGLKALVEFLNVVTVAELTVTQNMVAGMAKDPEAYTEALLEELNPGATVVVTTTHHGNNVYTTHTTVTH